MPNPIRYLFLDTETTGVSDDDEITEIGFVYHVGKERRTDRFYVEHARIPNQWVIENTDYVERILPRRNLWMSASNAVTRIIHAVVTPEPRDLTAPGSQGQTPTTYLVGAVPSFDDRFLRKLFAKDGRPIPYHYHLIDVETMAMAITGDDAPGSLKDLREKLGMEGANPQPHTALADAEEAEAIFNRVRHLQAAAWAGYRYAIGPQPAR